MANMMKSFRFKMIALFALSMVLAATVTYIIYKGLQLYYKKMVRYEEPLAQFRSMVREFGDINFF
ncbi:TPA: vancomycin resistance histidine kinase VanS, partial [Bacillus toyonensis]|nr:vancomycin resistance histidine kinase VanS [Bacillus toyonensis]